MKIVEKLKRIVAAFLAAVLFCSGQAFAAEPTLQRGRIGRLWLGKGAPPPDGGSGCGWVIKIEKDDFGEMAYYIPTSNVRCWVQQVKPNVFVAYYTYMPGVGKAYIRRNMFGVVLKEDGTVHVESAVPPFWSGTITRVPTTRSSLCVQAKSDAVPTPEQWRLSAAEIPTFSNVNKKGERLWPVGNFNRYILESPRGHFAYETPESLKMRDSVTHDHFIDVLSTVPRGVVYCVMLMHSFSMFDFYYKVRDPRNL